jgi:hypothetical protein
MYDNDRVSADRNKKSNYSKKATKFIKLITVD